MMLGRCLIGVLAAVVMARCLSLDLLGHRRGMLVITGIAGIGCGIGMIAALVLLPLFEALVLFYLYPVFAALLSPRVTGDKMTPSDWLLIGVAFSGTILILWSGHLGSSLQWGHLLAVAAAFAYGMTLTLIRLLSHKNNSLTPFFYISIVGCFVSAGPLLLQDAPLLIGTRGLIGILFITTFVTIALLASTKALNYMPSPKVGLISMSEIVLGALFGYMLFNEPLTWRSVLGAVLILGSGIRLTIKSGGES
jgi:drug/metabolite transporter (DMT)-like permease